ncbi:HEPN domain-containing protein [Roseobacter sp. HKCCA0434]|uniref:HEPN domain-containing protein n=1 Tax=Roseobacter sp. HKCCA0434 TaxID=3079297 RepID=UPI002905C210|nr:HEPN domain-containing protein [Roseobacter sp. HKCCA0434]
MANRHDFRHAELKRRQRAMREGFPPNFGLRIHRMISWIGRAEAEPYDPAASFIFLWIAFNAAYSDGSDIDGPPASERDRFRAFFRRALDCDPEHRLYRTAWRDGGQPIRAFIDNRYVFSPFWTHHHGLGCDDWEDRFRKASALFEAALRDGETDLVLSFMFDRLYMLRNQLIHGGATWDSSINRDQLRSGVDLLGALLPVVADLMMSCPSEGWGHPFFPVVDPSS